MNLRRPDSTWDCNFRKGKVHRLRENGLTLCDGQDYDGTIVDESVKVTCKRCLSVLGLELFRKEELVTTRRNEMADIKIVTIKPTFNMSYNGEEVGFSTSPGIRYLTRQELADALRDLGVTLPEPSPSPLKRGDIVAYIYSDGEVAAKYPRKVLMIDEKRFVLSLDNDFNSIGSVRPVSDYPTFWKVIGHEDV